MPNLVVRRTHKKQPVRSTRMAWSRLLSVRRLGRSEIEEITEGRSPFQKDYDRVVFSSAFRRLQDKTQVFPLATSDYVRTRLTHSLEVSCVGRSLGTIIGAHICRSARLAAELSSADVGAIVATACLAHDIGNPPFGHSGERAIQHWFTRSKAAAQWRDLLSRAQYRSLEKYEGNAQGFRLLTKLLTPDNPGLQLTFATLGAFLKYPNEAAVPESRRGNKASEKKFGIFESEAGQFENVAAELGLVSRSNRYKWYCRHPLAFLMEAADDICYRVIDLEDGCRLGLVDTKSASELLHKIIGDAKAVTKADEMRQQTAKIQYLRARAVAKLVDEVVDAFMDKEDELLRGTFDKALIDIIPSRKAIREVKTLVSTQVYPQRSVVEVEAAGFEIIGGLLDAFAPAVNNAVTKKGLSHHEKKLRELVPSEFYSTSRSPFTRLQKVLDFVCGMTDTYALTLFRTVRGISLPAPR